jgi:hypothetical protein
MSHQLSGINETERLAHCSTCGQVRIVSKGWQSGSRRWRCANRHEQLRHERRIGRHPYYWSARKADNCERCGFVPEHPVQLDLHNHRDSTLWETLCANCHRLQTLAEQKQAA